MAESAILVVVLCVAGGVAAFIIGMIVGSIGYVDYWELAFRRQKSTGWVDTSTVYEMGRYMIGPDYEMKTFKADGHFVTFKDVSIFTADRLEVKLTVHFVYFLKPEDLPLLHKKYDIYYKDIVETNALDAVKGASTVYETVQFISDRKIVEAALFKTVRDRLGGKCCLEGCEVKGNCIIGCTPLSDCGSDDKGLFADVRYFYVAGVDIPDEVGGRYLQALILQEQTEMEKNNQQAAVVRKETSQLVKNIQNEANEMDKYADAMSTLIMSKANANASAIREQARVDGLKLIFTDTKMQDDAHKASLDYLRTLRRMENAHISVDFTQFISGPTSP